MRKLERSNRQPKVAVPTTPPTPPVVRPLSWAFAAGLITVSVAALSLSRSLFRASQKLPKDGSTTNNVGSTAPLSSLEEAAVASMGPLLLAAETAAAVDETVHLSQEDLENLDLNLRMLITNMDAQLMELQDEIAAVVPSSVLSSWEALANEINDVELQLEGVDQGSDDAADLEKKLHGLQWDVFGVLQHHTDENSKRSYRSLLYNRGVQSQLLRQVERQLKLREDMQRVKSQLEALQNPAHAVEEENRTTAITSAPTYRLAAAGCAIPHPKKTDTGGEDAFFASSEYSAVGVADGVGGWAAMGIDPSEYPRKLIAACEIGAKTHTNPFTILTNAFEEVHAPGSCTLALAALDGDFLRVASLGDCGIRVLRDGRVIFASQVQEHSFNQPYQMGSPQFHPGNIPSDAHTYEVAVQKGDVIVLGSDGLWDNLWDHEVESLVAEHMGVGIAAGAVDHVQEEESTAVRKQQVQELADKLAALAAEHSTDRWYRSPFAAEKNEVLVPEGLKAIVDMMQGGKPDDVTAVVAAVW